MWIQPAVGFDRHRTGAIFRLADGMVAPPAELPFFLYVRVCNVAAQSQTDAAAGARLDEIILRPGIEGVLAIDELRMQHAIALVGRRRGTQVVEPFPVDQVLGAHDASVRPRSGEIRRSGILALAAEHAVQPAVLMLGDPHVVDVGFLRADIGQLYRMIPEAETVHPAVAFRHRKKGLAVVSFYRAMM